MGMAASQVRFLSLQSRKNTIGLNLMTLSNRKLALSRDMNRVAAEYNDAMNQKVLKWSGDSGVTYQGLNYDLLMKPNENNATLPYIVTDAQGRVVVDDKEIKLVDGIATGITYRDLATLISTYSGTNPITNKALYENIDNVKGGTVIPGQDIVQDTTQGNASVEGCAYTNVSNVYDYNIENNSLRYDLLSRLGVISGGDYETFLNASANISGNELGENFNSWSDVLNQYINEGGLTNTANPVTVSLSNPDGGISMISSDTYFGVWNAGESKFVGGCAKGNLAVAKYEMEQYKNWCNELHAAKLSDVTTHTFTGLSGIQLTQDTQPILSCLDSAIVSGASSDINTQINNLGLNKYGDFSNWSTIYNNSSSIGVTGLNGDSTAGTLLTIGSSLLDAINRASASGKEDAVDGWSITNTKEGDEVDFVTEAGETVEKDLAEAANEFALRETIKFYNNNWSNVKNIGKCYGTGQEGHAAANDSGYNGVVSAKRKWHWWEHLLNGVLTVVNIVSLGITNELAQLFGANGATGNFFAGMWNTDLAYAKNTGYSFDVSNFMKTYFTFYEMYIQTNGQLEEQTVSQMVDDLSLADGLEFQLADTMGGTSGQQYTECAYDSYYDATTGRTYDRYYTLNPDGTKNWLAERTATDTDGATRVYIDPDGNVYQTILKVSTDETGATVTSPAEERYKDAYGNFITKKTLADGTVTFKYSNSSGLQLAESDGSVTTSSYKDVTINYGADGSVSYSYDGGQPPQKEELTTTWVPVAGGTYSGGLKVQNEGSVFTDSISVYLTPNSNNINILQQRINDAQQVLDDANNVLDNVFSEKEKRLIAYFDSIFLQISKHGWVYDENVNSDDKEESQNYLNAMLQNNMYFVTEVDTLDGTDFNYATKLATNVSKIFEVYDEDAQNQALSKYESEKAEISSKEKQVDIRMNKLETEQDAIKTELDSLKKIIDDNVQATFKIFT